MVIRTHLQDNNRSSQKTATYLSRVLSTQNQPALDKKVSYNFGKFVPSSPLLSLSHRRACIVTHTCIMNAHTCTHSQQYSISTTEKPRAEQVPAAQLCWEPPCLVSETVTPQG